jgi:prepilin-type N-terminal cleavage/methylation domain-containing protein
VRQARRAFTLIEILIVVIILGILAAVAMPRFVDAQQGVREQSVKTELDMVRRQIEYYHFKENGYPASLAAMVTAGYLQQEPVHPNPGNYVYDPVTGAITSSEDASW